MKSPPPWPPLLVQQAPAMFKNVGFGFFPQHTPQRLAFKCRPLGMVESTRSSSKVDLMRFIPFSANKKTNWCRPDLHLEPTL
ncbi:hypothetical protein Taro_029502 [Colocasia esculenta]|uniref:Uncharacterized protein n=1 Tax=Colocasia esculenta TaxID=4460 RepID=A0A843VV23_COLES|nr:hypothetical protein [Colocasia esculenta]